MTGPEFLDTKQMHLASEAIDAACRKLQDNTAQIVGLISELSGCLNEAGISQQLRRLGESLATSDTEIHKRMLEVGQYLGETATVVETVVNESQADLEATTKQVSSPGSRYGSALNG
jgi:hypothetical protein